MIVYFYKNRFTFCGYEKENGGIYLCDEEIKWRLEYESSCKSRKIR